MKLNKTLFSLTLACSLIAGVSQAQELVQRSAGRMMQGARPQGMGNAFSAVKGSDSNAIFYNPAAINDYEPKLHMQFLLPAVEFSYKAIDFIANDVTDLADDIDAAATDSAKIDAFDAFAATNTGRYEEVGIRGNAAIAMHKYFTAALFYETQSVVALLNPASSTIDVEALAQGGLMLGSAYNFFDEQLQVGAAVKFMERWLVDETVTQRDVIAEADFGDAFDFDQFGFGIGFDLGIKASPLVNSKTWEILKPTFSAVLQDIGHTRFFAGDDVGQQKQSLTLGTAISPKVGPFEAVVAVDVKDVDRKSDFLNKFHAGTEWTLPEISKVLRSVSARVGINQAYFAGGLGLDFKYFKIDAATYGKEIAANTIQKQSRIFTLQLGAGF